MRCSAGRGEDHIIKEKTREEKEARYPDMERPEINWDKVADVYRIEELIKNIKF